MSSFKHCEVCDHPMDRPTPREDLIDGQPCPLCEHRHYSHFSLAEWVIDLWDEIQELKGASHD